MKYVLKKFLFIHHFFVGIYLVLGLLGSLMICQPPEDWIRRKSLPTSELELEKPLDRNEKQEKNALMLDENDNESYVTWKEALKSKEFYLLWVTRLSIVLITQVIFLNDFQYILDVF